MFDSSNSREKLLASRSEAYHRALDVVLAPVPTVGEGHSVALENDTQAPDFELSNQFGETVRLSDFRGKHPVVLVFFPLAFSGVCTGELCALRDKLSWFTTAGVELIGISVDSKWSLRAWAEHEGYEFQLLSDFWPHGAVARQYGVFLDDRGVANRATFVIDTQGVIRDSFITAPGEARDIERYRQAVATVAPASVRAVDVPGA